MEVKCKSKYHVDDKYCHACYMREYTRTHPKYYETIKSRTKDYYKNNLEAKKEYSRKRRFKNTAIIKRYKVLKGCKDCDIHDERILEFDHVPERGVKSFKIMSRVACSLTFLKEEIDKCDLVCANCHKIRTWTRRMEKK